VFGIHHVQLAMPAGREDEARAFYGALLGLEEVAKPPGLAARGGVWFRSGELELHLGVEEGFAPARKAHPGIAVPDGAAFDALVARLEAGGIPVHPDIELPGHRRFHTEDSFGNRLEFLTPEDGPLEQVRRLCLALPEVTERISHGEPTWFVRGKRTFVTYAERHHDDRVAFWCAAPEGAQAALVAADPERYYVPPYVGHRGWLGVRLDVPVDWDEIRDLITDAYRQIAPRTLVARLDNP